MILRTPAFWYKPLGVASFFLSLFSMLYWVGHRIHQALAKPKSAPCPTICVGNIVAGGSGKTPVVQALVKLLGPQTFVLLRGYRAATQTPKMVNTTDNVATIGDEALLHARYFPTIISANRLLGAELASAQNAKMIVMDDGFQNTTLKPDLKFMVIDGESGFGNGLLLPAGPLRQTVESGLAECDAVIISNPTNTYLPKSFAKPVFSGCTQVNANIQAGRTVVGFAGIGRPDKFYKTLQNLGLNIADFRAFADHYPYTDSEIKNLLKLAREHKAQLITTEKDAVRIPDKTDLLSIAVVKLQFEFDQPNDILNFIKSHEKFSL